VEIILNQPLQQDSLIQEAELPKANPGIFGKIPAHGDFVDRNLRRSFINTWDDWLQRCVACSQEQLGSEWLDIYLTSPIWRFVASTGAIDNTPWAGILVPSVDSVGRYFPLTIAQPISTDVNLFDFQATNDDWFTKLEEIAVSSLQNYLNADSLADELTAPNELINIPSQSRGSRSLVNGIVSTTNTNIKSAYAQLLHQVMTPQAESYSLWWTQGSQRMPPSLLHVKGLPQAQQYAAFLDGQWNLWST
jgi:type VI secretion system protein ImpM